MLNNISITLNTTPLLLLLGIVVFGTYTYFILKFSLPPISKTLKFILLFTRTLSLTLILFILFEPTLVIKNERIIKPKNLIFIDNSESIVNNDSLARVDEIKSLVTKLDKNDINPQFYTFGGKITSINPDSLEQLKFNEVTTNFEKIYSFLKKKSNNIASVTIISDGQITDGENPSSEFERLGAPVFTIGIGDTNKNIDLAVAKVLFNKFIYQGSKTEIKIFIKNKNLSNRKINISLLEGKKLIDKKKIEVKSNQLSSVIFDYLPVTYGNKKITILIDKLTGEDSYENNKKVIFINVLKSKLKLLLISGSPSEDVSFILNSLKLRKEYEVKNYIQLTKTKFNSSLSFDQLADSADILLLAGFPSKYTPSFLIQKVHRLLNKKNKPFFIILSAGTDLSKLKQFEDILNFKFENVVTGFQIVQPQIVDINNAIVKNNATDPILEWNSLPPVEVYNTDFKAKVNSNILAVQKFKNFKTDKPLILYQILGERRSISVLANGIWQWKLQLVPKRINLFDSFLYNSIRWLNLGTKQKRFNLSTTKKLYSSGEKIVFTGQLYDNTMTPLDDAVIEVEIIKDTTKYNLQLTTKGNGIYEGEIEALGKGDYKFFGKALKSGKILAKSTGKFNVGDIDIEKLNNKMNVSFLKNLANNSGGRFLYLNKTSNINKELSNFVIKNIKRKTEFSEIRIWSKESILILIILLFGLEWFLRKRSGML